MPTSSSKQSSTIAIKDAFNFTLSSSCRTTCTPSSHPHPMSLWKRPCNTSRAASLSASKANSTSGHEASTSLKSSPARSSMHAKSTSSKTPFAPTCLNHPTPTDTRPNRTRHPSTPAQPIFDEAGRRSAIASLAGRDPETPGLKPLPFRRLFRGLKAPAPSGHSFRSNVGSCLSVNQWRVQRARSQSRYRNPFFVFTGVHIAGRSCKCRRCMRG